jgi:predicted transcriptional regulator
LWLRLPRFYHISECELSKKEITTSQHTIVSSDDLDEFEEKVEEMENKMDLHEAVSSEELLPEEAEEVLEADDFEGVAEAVLEEVEGFDESYALSEAELGEEVAVTEALEAMPEAGELEFGEPEFVSGGGRNEKSTSGAFAK